MINLWPLLLPAAAWSGWWVANRNNSSKNTGVHNRLSREYVVGLNYLLNEQSDKAVDIFIKLLEVDSDTVETHLALGSLFRRRGEVDRAIRIHQNLIARPQLSLLQRKEALMALGQDYMSAGVFDRAERIFLSEIIEPLVLCHRELDLMADCIDYLEQTLAEHPRASVIFVIAEYLRQNKNMDDAIDFVADNLRKHPSIRGLNRLIYWHLESAHGKVRDKLQMLYDITSKFLDNTMKLLTVM